MGVDFGALKKRLRRMEEQKAGNYGDKPKRPKWNPPEGKTEVRIVPMSLTEDFMPISVLQLIYQIKVDNWNHTIVSLKGNFGKADPFAELQSELFSRKTDNTKEWAKKLFPRDSSFVPVIVRGQEDLGVRWWGINKTIDADLMDKLFDERWGDMTHPETGRDITVTRILKKGDESYDTIKAAVSPVTSLLADDPEQVKTWVETIPDIHEVFPVQTYDELDELAQKWIQQLQGSVKEEDIDSGVDYASGNESKKSEESVIKEDGTYDDIDDAFDDILKD